MRTRRNINCDEATRLISAGLDRELTPPARASLRLHYAVCSACKRFEQQMHVLRNTLRGLRVGDESAAPAEPADAPEPGEPGSSGDRQP